MCKIINHKRGRSRQEIWALNDCVDNWQAVVSFSLIASQNYGFMAVFA